MDEPDPDGQQRSCGSRVDDAWADKSELVAVIREDGAAGRKNVAAPIGVGSVEEANDEALVRRLREHRCAVGSPSPTADMVHDGDGQGPGDSKDDRVEDRAIDPGHRASAPPTGTPDEEVRGERSREEPERAGGERRHAH